MCKPDVRKLRALIYVPNIFNNDTLDRLAVNLQHTCSVNEQGGGLLLEKHHVIKLGCFIIDLTYLAKNAAYKEIR